MIWVCVVCSLRTSLRKVDMGDPPLGSSGGGGGSRSRSGSVSEPNSSTGGGKKGANATNANASASASSRMLDDHSLVKLVLLLLGLLWVLVVLALLYMAPVVTTLCLLFLYIILGYLLWETHDIHKAQEFENRFWTVRHIHTEHIAVRQGGSIEVEQSRPFLSPYAQPQLFPPSPCA